MIAAIGPEGAEKACQRLLYRTVRIAIKSNLMPTRRIPAAVDYHKMPFTGKARDGNVAPGKPGGGTSRLEGCMTAHHVGMPGPLGLAVRRIAAGMGRTESVAAVPSATSRLGITVRILLMDSEFCTVAIMTAIHA